MAVVTTSILKNSNSTCTATHPKDHLMSSFIIIQIKTIFFNFHDYNGNSSHFEFMSNPKCTSTHPKDL